MSFRATQARLHPRDVLGRAGIPCPLSPGLARHQNGVRHRGIQRVVEGPAVNSPVPAGFGV